MKSARSLGEITAIPDNDCVGKDIRTKIGEQPGDGVCGTMIEAETRPDHIHMLVSIPPKSSVVQYAGYLKGKSSLMLFDRHASLKYMYGDRQFWCRGYYVDTASDQYDILIDYLWQNRGTNMYESSRIRSGASASMRAEIYDKPTHIRPPAL